MKTVRSRRQTACLVTGVLNSSLSNIYFEFRSQSKGVEEVGWEYASRVISENRVAVAIRLELHLLTNITVPPISLVKQGMSLFRHSHFDLSDALFRNSEVIAVLLSEIGCAAALAGLWNPYRYTVNVETAFWVYIVLQCGVNHWFVCLLPSFLSSPHTRT
jgi:omega-6 fatty acid desaturase (delta-12 desaturase)